MAKREYADAWYRRLVPVGMCHWCSVQPATTRDHRVPLNQGGQHVPSNIVFACERCNYGRGNVDVIERKRPRW